MSSRRIEDLCPAVQVKCKEFLDLCRLKGISLIITSTLRTKAEQLAYYAQGRGDLKFVNNLRKIAGLGPISASDNRRIVTKTLTSIHEFGCAFDVAISRAGTVIWEIKADINANNIPDYEEIGKIGESLGLRWGGRFTSRDYVHFEYTGGLSVADLKTGKRPEGGATC
jgi:peptidoglycan L-alanyl-D-glutamate endopeptidase CwlK